MNRCKGGICCALALAMLCLSLPCPAEEAPLPAETAAPILTEAPVEAEATPEIAEPAVTESAEPEPAATPEPEETPLPETPAPEVTPASGPSIGFLSASHALAHVGQEVEWRFHAENAGKLSYCITNASGSAVASGELAPDARQVRWAPGEAGEYQITLTAEGAGVVSVCSSVSVVAALAGELTGLNPSYFAGDALTFTAAVSGGASPLAYRMTAEWNGEIFAQEERADGRFALTLPGADAAGMLRIQVVCTDAIGERLTLEREIPCAVHQRETRRQWEKASYVRKSGCWPRDLVSWAMRKAPRISSSTRRAMCGATPGMATGGRSPIGTGAPCSFPSASPGPGCLGTRSPRRPPARTGSPCYRAGSSTTGPERRRRKWAM